MKSEYIFENRKTGKEIRFILDSQETNYQIRDGLAISEAAEKEEINEDDLILNEVF